MKTNRPIIMAALFSLFLLAACSQTPSAQQNPNTDTAAMTSRQIAQLCLPEEGNVLHIHSNLVIMVNKKQVKVPENIGIDIESRCIHPLHTHDEAGIIHVESPQQKDFTLSDFFAVWNETFNKNQILDEKIDSNHGLKFYVNGQESNQFENTILHDHQDLFVDYYDLKAGPDPLPEKFNWEAFENPQGQSMLPPQTSDVKKFNLSLKGKKLVSGPEILQVNQGDQVEITITSDQPEELHLHGYDKSVEFQKDLPATLSFTANISGHFEYELENVGIEIGALEVQPQ